jgi:16S rRNA (uracil1498-N3)-methyltransferase
MDRYDFRTQRLHTMQPLKAGGSFELDRAQANYLLNVLRLKEGDGVLLFNGIDGEWLARIAPQGRKSAGLALEKQTRPQPPAADLTYCFAPLKQARLDYMVQKAVEMGAGVLQPVITQHTQVARLNIERMQANAVEAAEQCGILALPQVREPVGLAQMIEQWEPQRALVYCDEAKDDADPLEILAPLKGKPLGVLVGPEGGFSSVEREMLRSQPFVVAIPLGPRILRADTAAVAALAVVQAAAGDWVK